MSDALINNPNAQHSFVDDLESTVYILMWMTLMYSSINEPAQARLFLSNTLDPQPFEGKGGHAKSDFLKGRTLLSKYKFPGRDALHNLIDRLADMLSVRYSTLSEEDKSTSDTLKQLLERNPGSLELQSLYDKSPEQLANKKREQLLSHDAAINLFNAALRDQTIWPTNDAPEKQDFALPKLNAEVTEKTNFDPSMTLVLGVSEKETDCDAEHDTASDRSTVRNLFGNVDKPHGLDEVDNTGGVDWSDADSSVDMDDGMDF
jgi:hypothetical protein